MSRLSSDPRAASPVVGKALEAGIVVLYIGLLLTVLYGGLVPDYRAAAGEEVSDRVLAEASQELQTAVPASETATARTDVDLPSQIQGSDYRLRATAQDGQFALVLEHPRQSVNGRIPVLLPEDVTEFEGRWASTDTTVVVVEQREDGRAVKLRAGEQE